MKKTKLKALTSKEMQQIKGGTDEGKKKITSRPRHVDASSYER